jgi:hypothetical protein
VQPLRVGRRAASKATHAAEAPPRRLLDRRNAVLCGFQWGKLAAAAALGGRFYAAGHDLQLPGQPLSGGRLEVVLCQRRASVAGCRAARTCCFSRLRDGVKFQHVFLAHRQSARKPRREPIRHASATHATHAYLVTKGLRH